MKKISILMLSCMIILTFFACSKHKAPSNSGTNYSQDVTFYFPDEAVMYLCPETRKVTAAEHIFMQSVVDAIIKGPATDGLKPSISGDVKILSISTGDGIFTLDLSSEFRDANTGGTTKEVMAIYSIVNTLCSIDGIEKVKINIDGDETPEFGGHFSLDEALEPDFSLVKE